MKDITVNTKLAAIIGTDIGHSKSPAMMNAAFQKLAAGCLLLCHEYKGRRFRNCSEGYFKNELYGAYSDDSL